MSVNDLQKRSACRKKKPRKKGFDFKRRNNNEKFKKRENKKREKGKKNPVRLEQQPALKD